MTTGTALTAELRRCFHIGPRTRRYRRHGHVDLHVQMVVAIEMACYELAYWSPAMTALLRPGIAAAASYRKHVVGCRIGGAKIAAVNGMSAWRFSAFLGQMVDAGVTNVGQGERFLNSWKQAA
jgi:hypothetical protein